MNSDPTTIKQARQVYEKYWDSYLSGNLEVFADTIDDELSLIGTSESEISFGKDEGIALLTAQFHEVVGKAERRHRQVKEIPVGDQVLIIEFCDIYVLVDAEWRFYSKLRLSTLMRQSPKSWKVFQQHGSLPDQMVEGDETVAIERINKENAELRTAVKRRTIELEHKTRELEIEAALERVRSRSMAMHKSQELPEVIQVVYDQFAGLKIPVDHAGFILDYKEREDMRICLADHQQGVPSEIAIPYFDSPHWNSFVEAKSRGENFFANLLDFEEKNKFYKDLMAVMPTMPEETIQNIYNKPALTISTVLLDNVGLYIENYSGTPFTDEENAILMRFGKAFQQTYTRFLDLQKAEAQAKEAQIEAALERLRSQSNAMRDSSDIEGVTLQLFDEFEKFGRRPDQLSISIFQKDAEAFSIWARRSEKKEILKTTIPYDFHSISAKLVEAWQNQDPILTIDLTGDSLQEYNEKRNELVVNSGHHIPMEKRRVIVSSVVPMGLLSFASDNMPDEETIHFLQRLARVFDQTYSRFRDIEKAEAQAREAKIETALEKVRSRTMGMQSSDDLPEVANLMFMEVQSLGIPAWSCGYCIELEDGRSGNCIMSSEGTLQKPFVLPYHGEDSFDEWNDFVHSERTFFTQELGGKAIESHYDHMKSLPQLGPIFHELAEAGLSLPTYQINHLCKFSYGFLLFITYERIPGAHDVFKRFTKVFDQTYTRFLDLQKAEAQARDAKIEAALERVRSASMAMHRSDELQKVVNTIITQLNELKVSIDTTQIVTMHGPYANMELWTAMNSNPQDISESWSLPYGDVKLLRELHACYASGAELFHQSFKTEEKNEFYRYVFSQTDFVQLNEDRKQFILNAPIATLMTAFVNKIAIQLISYSRDKFNDEEADILKRFAKVFSQSHTRFLDLQKAEAQAREAKIEAALEKVRSRTMGMQRSDELADVANVLFAEMNGLVHNLWTCGFVLCEKERAEDEWWLSLEDGFSRGFYLPNVNDYAHATLYEGWLDGDVFRTVQLDGAKLQEHYDWLIEVPVAKNIFDEMEAAGMERPEWQKLHAAYFSKGYLVIITREPCREEEIFKRFATVFDQTYTRFLDLKKAEAQARESQIEAALEKVRSRSLAMQSPDELIEVAQLLRDEMGALGVEELETSSIYIHDENSGNTQCWFTIKDSPSGKAVTDQMTLSLQDTWVGREMKDFYRSKAERTSILMQGAQRVEWIRYCGEKSNVFTPEGFYGATIPERTYHLYKFSNGYIGAASPGEISGESWDLLKRATSVFSFAYTRFRDLQNAEGQAREARIELSLERIRGLVASMQESSDLLDIVVTMRTEFVKLGHEAHYFWHMRWLPETYAKAMTSGDGTKIGMVMTLPRHIHGDITTVANWEKSEEPVHVLAMDIDTAMDYVEKMITLGDFEQVDPQAPTLDDIRHIGGLTFVMARTTHGEIGYSLPGVVPDPPKDAVDTLVRFAGVFDLAYKRFEDLKSAEHQALMIREERDRLEIALTELRATQTQLIQQEKLASLGQLTAGIAHEIKNPLNFVNNFSELSMELIDEVMELLGKPFEKGTARELGEILGDVKSNLTKIHQHGTRADGIVKSMLQHSRGGSGKMEPTDLNALITEFVNLAFHGMRAAKNPINVKLDFDLDQNLGQVNLIGEDFSRVILNLANNAFDAMREKTKTDPEYKAVLTVSSHLNVGVGAESGTAENEVEISITDNGPGIPEAIKDKILQPFFTTKKGTEGTGLGLSITHDIVKAHGGILRISSRPGETIFQITLPS